ncbi:VWA domain-containing protein [Sulfurimonas sp.]|nr:VWA domain-containing protein [Sulfurimonas sp.]
MMFLFPEYFWLLLLLVPVLVLKNYKEIGLVSFGYMLTFTLLVLALTRPVIEQKPIKSEQVLSDVIVAVDLSYSMSATDIEPSRLGRAKKLLKKLVKSDTNTRYAVIGFTTNAIVLSPLTEDSELLLHLYDGLNENLVMTKGSSIMPALELAAKMSKSKSPSVVILSDGADELSYEVEAKFAKKRGLVVNTLMLATTLGSTLQANNGELVKDEIGDIVVSRENDAIEIISRFTDGVYTKSYDELLAALYDQKNTEYKTQTMVMQNMEFFYYAVALAILVFLVSVTTLKKYVISFLLLFGISVEANSSFEYFEQATQEYKDGKYEKALDNFERIKSSNVKVKAVLYYNIGNSYVRLKEFKKAREAYLKSLTLEYSLEADENMRYIAGAEEQMQMSTGQEKAKKKSAIAKKRTNSKQQKEGAGSNMKVSAPASSGSEEMGKKTKSDPMLNLNKGNAKLSSKQYELINKRGSNETKPW